MDNLAPKFDVKPPSPHSVKFYPMVNAPNASTNSCTNTAQFEPAYLALIKLRCLFQQFKRFPVFSKRTKGDISYRKKTQSLPPIAYMEFESIPYANN